ncbi:MAG: toll/interleukin-1 receptor domain-containing protein [Nitrospiraceae bacterium]
MGHIFISYRRDNPGFVRALRSEMKHKFGDRQVFLDVEDIEAGSDFTSIIENALTNCEVLLVIIGPKWLTVTDRFSQRRLDVPNDFVRLEIAHALGHSIPTIPVLIEGATMPSEDDLPVDLRPLARLQGVPLSHVRWDEDVDRLFQAIEHVTDEPKLSRWYAEALTVQSMGQWEDALHRFEAIESIRPNYRDVIERMQPLRELTQAAEGLGPAPRGWRHATSRFPILAMLFVASLPNILAAWFNFIYNWQVIVLPMQERGMAQVERLFQSAALICNGVSFPVGLGLFVWLAWPVARVLRQLRRDAVVPVATLGFTRERCLKLGHFAAIIGSTLWVILGPVYPLMIGVLEPRNYVYFIASLAICGMIAATYPFLGVTWLCTRVLYLPLVRPGSTTSQDGAALERLRRWIWRYLLLAGVLPMLAITLGLTLSPLAGSTRHSTLLGMLGLGGLGGFVLAIGLFRSIQNDLELLRQVVKRSSSHIEPVIRIA